MAQGLRFECQPGCTACCRQQGFVFLTEDDLRRAARHLKMTPAAFERKYVYRTRNLMRLRVPRYSTCHFLTDEGCGIHEGKPLQCRAYPYWPELVENRREWLKAAHMCPGIGKGPLIQIETARAMSDKMKSAHPTLYGL